MLELVNMDNENLIKLVEDYPIIAIAGAAMHSNNTMLSVDLLEDCENIIESFIETSHTYHGYTIGSVAWTAARIMNGREKQ